LLVIFVVQISHLFKAVATDDYELNKRINARNEAYATGNSMGFTDKERSVKKPKGIYRIAVLGDSFIWGDGMPYEKIWSHKLEKRLLEKYDSIEVISWGHNGWSTLDEFTFYKERGKDFDVDLLIIGWVDNDPDVGKIKQGSPKNPKNEYPFLYRLSPSLAQAKVNEVNSQLILSWVAQLYTESNLKDYQTILNGFTNYMTQHNTPVIMVMTPSLFCSYTKGHFDTVRPLIVKAGFTCLDLYAPAEKKLGHYSNLALQANSVNAHPGNLLTEEFAIEVQDYLEQIGYLKHLPKKGLKD
jgi:hypothetical protein